MFECQSVCLELSQDCQCHLNYFVVIYWCSMSCNLFFEWSTDHSHVPYLEEILLMFLYLRANIVELALMTVYGVMCVFGE